MRERLEVIHYAVSLGHQRSLIYWLRAEALLKTSFLVSEAQAVAYRDWAGEGLFRFSVGLEDPEDLIADLEAVLG